MQREENRKERRLEIDEKRVRIEKQLAAVNREGRMSLIVVNSALANKLK